MRALFLLLIAVTATADPLPTAPNKWTCSADAAGKIECVCIYKWCGTTSMPPADCKPSPGTSIVCK